MTGSPLRTGDAATQGVRAYFLFQLFFSLLLWTPIFYAYQVRMGLSDAQIFGIQSIYYAAFCLFELPTGWLADTVGHARCLRWGAAVLVAANLLPVVWPTYVGFLWHWLGIALARSLVSGASSAWLYEYLRRFGKPEGFKEIEGRARALGLVGKVVGWAGVGYLMDWHVTLPYTLTALAAAISYVYATRLPVNVGSASVDGPASEARTREADAAPSVKVSAAPDAEASAPVWWAVGKVLMTSPFLVLVIAQGVASFVLQRIVQVNLFQPVLEVRGLGSGACGVIMAVSTLFEAAGSAWPNALRSRMTDLSAVFFLTTALAASTAGIALSGAWGAVTWLCVFALATGLVIPIQRQVINDAIPAPRYRASVMSAESLIDRASCAAVAPLLGVAVAGGATAHLLLWSAGVTLASVVVLLAASRAVRARTHATPHPGAPP